MRPLAFPLMPNRVDGPIPGLALSARARRTAPQPISYLIQTALDNPGLINLAAGLVDPRTLPVAESAAIAGQILSDPARGRPALQYETTQGLAELRRAAVQHLESLESKSAAQMGFAAEDVIVTTGSQQALFLIGDVLIDPGDIVITANPCYFVYTSALAALGADVRAVPMDEQGLDTEAVASLLDRLSAQGLGDRVRMIYVTSWFQNPTGLTLSLARRNRLLEIVQRFGGPQRLVILEDAAYRELRYDGADLPSIKSMDSENRHTILACTFSKPFAPGLKTGYTVLPADLREAVLRQKGHHDFGSSSLTQHIAAEALSGGAYARQVATLRRDYQAKRDAMLAALAKYMPASVHWTRPGGGFYVWVTFPRGVDTSREGGMFDAAVKAGVLYVPGDYCFQPDESGRVPRHHLRLSFGQVAPEQIEPGIRRLAAAAAVAAEKVESGREKAQNDGGGAGGLVRSGERGA